METRDGYLLCPICQRQKVLRILPGTEGKQIAVYCKNCRKESIVNIEQKSLSQRA
ncbi:MAG: cysteine-rich KTR domain-containing protein [Firmicutes bacterium]|nr:cysteine-rich KTR domain-containing protein [Bacillota bacterium]